MPEPGGRRSPLDGIRVVELAGQGPGPHAAMMLADLGADVVRVLRPGAAQSVEVSHTFRGRTVVEADLKDGTALAEVRELIDRADVLIEGFRPGVVERLGVGPAETCARNPRLVYGRMTGWGQDGPYARRAGHDINYISVTGALHAIGDHGPVPPLNLLGDYGGGSMMLLAGILAALFERERSGRGQVVDAAMVDGVAYLLQAIWGHIADGSWIDRPGSNALDGGAPFYRTYRCADGKYVAVGAIEPPFYERLIAGLELEQAALPPQQERSSWPQLAEAIGAAFSRRTRDEWTAVFDGTDACVTPVLSFAEATFDPHAQARSLYRRAAGGVEVAPAPRLSAAPTTVDAVVTRAAARDVVERWSASPLVG